LNKQPHRYLLTGASGFVAKHFLDLLGLREPGCEVLGLDLQAESQTRASSSFHYRSSAVNLINGAEVERILLDFLPTRLLHLASASNVGTSWKTPVESFSNNTNIFLNLLDVLRRNNLPARVLSVGSSEEYGNVRPEDLPLVEMRELKPSSPYGVARVAQEQLGRVFVEGYGMDVVMSRSFNHIGPGQREQFVVPSFVKQVMQAKKSGARRCHIRTGNTQVIRDFLDVRDVVRAYHSLFEAGRSGEVYNICSGTGRSLDQVLAVLGDVTEMTINHQADPELLRPNELAAIVGSFDKAKRELGWEPLITFRESLIDLVAYWGRQLE